MYSGPKLGNAIRQAIDAKGITQRALARHFDVSPPTVQDWIKRGTIGKDKLEELWAFFADVAGPEHWGMQRGVATRADDAATVKYEIGPRSLNLRRLVTVVEKLSEADVQRVLDLAEALAAPKQPKMQNRAL